MNTTGKSILYLFILCILLIGACTPQKAAQSQAPPTVVFPDGWTVQVKLAVTSEQHARGLMFVKHLADDRGMLFLFKTEAKRPFWMKNCLIPLDMIWLDANGTIVGISADEPPCREDPCPNIFPQAPCRNVLEVRGGLAADHHLQVGQRLVFVGVHPLQRPSNE
ncbi:MAG: DUF192 domain-containing protein [Acidobacteriota bacterium]|jgi:uncharacterized protein